MNIRLGVGIASALFSIAHLIYTHPSALTAHVIVAVACFCAQSWKHSSEFFVMHACWAALAALASCCHVSNVGLQIIPPISFTFYEISKRRQTTDVSAWSVASRAACIQAGNSIARSLTTKNENLDGALSQLRSDSFFIADEAIAQQRLQHKENAKYAKSNVQKWPFVCCVLISLNILGTALFTSTVSSSVLIFCAYIVCLGVASQQPISSTPDFEIGIGSASALLENKPYECLVYVVISCIAACCGTMAAARVLRLVAVHLVASVSLYMRSPATLYAGFFVSNLLFRGF